MPDLPQEVQEGHQGILGMWFAMAGARRAMPGQGGTYRPVGALDVLCALPRPRCRPACTRGPTRARLYSDRHAVQRHDRQYNVTAEQTVASYVTQDCHRLTDGDLVCNLLWALMCCVPEPPLDGDFEHDGAPNTSTLRGAGVQVSMQRSAGGMCLERE